MAGYDKLDPTSSKRIVPDFMQRLSDNVGGLRIGVPKNYFFERCDNEVGKAAWSAIDLLKEIRCIEVNLEFPHIEQIMAAFNAIDMCESSSVHERLLTERASDYTSDVRLALEEGLFIPARQVHRALEGPIHGVP